MSMTWTEREAGPVESHQDYLAALETASGLIAALPRSGLPPLDLTAAQLTDSSQDLARLLYAAHLFLHQPDMRPPKLESLRLQTDHLDTSFRALASTKGLYIEGLHPVCKNLVKLHQMVRLEHAHLIESFAIFSAARF